jgi:DNA-directed RNA polymerase specialized sigma24 family protein
MNGGAVHVETAARGANDRASDEPEFPFLAPDESITEETLIADPRISTPEQIVGSREVVRLIAGALRNVASGQREAFMLHAMEGFSVEQIAAITGDPPEQVAHAISATRDHLRKSPQMTGHFRERRAATGAA